MLINNENRDDKMNEKDNERIIGNQIGNVNDKMNREC